MDMESLRKYIYLSERKQELKEEIERIDGLLQTMEAELYSEFEEAGIKSMTVDGHTVYTSKTLWAKPVDGDYERACAALESAGLGDFVERRFNIHKLSAFVRELEKNQQDIPAEFDGAIEVKAAYSLRVRKA
jgi:hypothetical protein